MAESAELAELAQPIGGLAPDEILARFVGWSEARGLRPYPVQEEAFLELLEGKHVVLATPTGSGKSLVAQLMHFKALCEGKRSFYTSPIKALVSEKFFALCNAFGPANVGMLTGDASINAGAPIVCCTAEVLANMALRRGDALQVPYAALDEFHFYSDPSRGWAWQVPLLTLRDTTFLLMSATLGDTTGIRRDLAARSGREVALVASNERPVPLDFTYCETPLHETVADLLEDGKAPIYVVSFTQREAAELAQSLTSISVATRAERDQIHAALGDFAFDSPYGKELARLIRAGIGIHHAGLLPKYRLLVEQLSQQGLLKIISGTDTLGVGVNIPIRTVLFTKLAKFDGRKVGPLSVREFRQIAGRAGRKGFDERGSVVCQAPEHVIENKRMRARSAGKKKKREVTKKPPPGFVGWNEETFERLIEKPAEPLVSRFRVTHGMLVLLLRQGEEDPDPRRGWRLVAELIGTSHEDERHKRHLLRGAAQLFRGLRAADIVRIEVEPATGRRRVRVADDLQWDFSLHHALSLYLVEAISYIEARDEAFALEVLSLIEAVLEDPRAILFRQLDRIKGDLVQRLKAEGVPYEERMRRLDEVEPPAPSRAFIEQTFSYFAQRHPWVQREDVRPKSIARELVEGYWDFDHYVRFYGLQRIEGLLLRYLGEVYGSLVQTVPDAAKTEAVHDVIAYLRALLERVDTSLVQEWERMLHPELRDAPSPAQPAESQRLRTYDLAADPRELRARVRAELHRLARALAAGDWEEASRLVHRDPDDPWTPERFERALEPFRAEYGEIVFTPRARDNEWTRLEPDGARRWRATQILLDRDDDNFWCIEAEVDLSGERDPVGPLLRVQRVGT